MWGGCKQLLFSVHLWLWLWLSSSFLEIPFPLRVISSIPPTVASNSLQNHSHSCIEYSTAPSFDRLC
uniref:Secreted protein n=1 Tax=Cucumis sativus TaxID=3659 RepID=A0A0A0LBE6_CUCSA